MKISETIKMLQKAISDYGDLDCVVAHYIDDVDYEKAIFDCCITTDYKDNTKKKLVIL